MINWRVVRGTENPVEVMDMETQKIVLRVYDWTGDGNTFRRTRFIKNLQKAGMIILAVKMLETN